MKKFLTLTYLLVYILAGSVAMAQGGRKLSLSIVQVCDVADLLPSEVEVRGSSQGMAINGRYAFLMHDKGQCVVVDMKRWAFVATYVMEGNTGHCNNASFGRERYGKKSQFPLLYVSECRGERACYVNDVSFEGSRLVQKIFYDGADISGPADWLVDSRAQYLWLYCTVEGERTLKAFELPRLSDSDSRGEVHLHEQDVVKELYAGEVAIPQGSMIHRNRVYLPDGVPSRNRKLHVVNIKTGEVMESFDLNHIAYEPEGVARKGRKMYLSFHTPRNPRQNRIYQFRLKSRSAKRVD